MRAPAKGVAQADDRADEAGDIVGLFDPGIFSIAAESTCTAHPHFGAHHAGVKRKQFVNKLAQEGAVQIFHDPVSAWKASSAASEEIETATASARRQGMPMNWIAIGNGWTPRAFRGDTKFEDMRGGTVFSWNVNWAIDPAPEAVRSRKCQFLNRSHRNGRR